jgi:hypothetical protein
MLPWIVLAIAIVVLVPIFGIWLTWDTPTRPDPWVKDRVKASRRNWLTEQAEHGYIDEESENQWHTEEEDNEYFK